MLYQIKLYIKYILHRKSRYNTHSPFIFDFINNVLRKKTEPSKKARIKLLNNKKILKKIELGAGSSKKNKKLTIANSTRVSAVNKKYSRLLFHIAKHYQPQNILELGTHFGLGTLAFHEGNPNATITSVEGCPNTHRIAINTIKEFAQNSHEINLINSSFEKFINSKNNLTYNCIYIDGNHKKEATLKYFDYAIENASDFCIIILDDINWNQEMDIAWQSIVQQNKYYTINLFRMGVVIVNKPLKPQHFILKY